MQYDKTDGTCIMCGQPGTMITSSWTPPEYREDLDPPRYILERKCWSCYEQQKENENGPISQKRPCE
jgi:hypothetical protein